MAKGKNALAIFMHSGGCRDCATENIQSLQWELPSARHWSWSILMEKLRMGCGRLEIQH